MDTHGIERASALKAKYEHLASSIHTYLIANILIAPATAPAGSWLQNNVELVKVETFRSKTNVWYANALLLIKWADYQYSKKDEVI